MTTERDEHCEHISLSIFTGMATPVLPNVRDNNQDVKASMTKIISPLEDPPSAWDLTDATRLGSDILILHGMC